jgi:hypothetical protein
MSHVTPQTATHCIAHPARPGRGVSLCPVLLAHSLLPGSFLPGLLLP